MSGQRDSGLPDKMTPYDQICGEIWDFFTKHKDDLAKAFKDAKGSKQDVIAPWLPPPPDRCKSKVRLLVVGLSPKWLPKFKYPVCLETAKKQTSDYRYVGNGHTDIQKNYDTYYKPLLKLAKEVDHKGRFGVWHEVANDQNKFLVDFTDFCHLPAVDHKVLQSVLHDSKALKRHCREVLKAELKLYTPDIVIANGVDASVDLAEMHFNKPFNECDPVSFIRDFLEIEGCTVHLSGFISGARAIDRFNKQRLLNEIRSCANFLKS